MLSIAHGVTGALIFSKIQNPYIAIPLCIAAHFIEDAVPHWDFGQGLSCSKKSLKTAFFQELLVDFPLSILLVLPLALTSSNPLIPYLGWFFCILPDFLEAPRLFLKKRLPVFSYLHDFHELVHRSTPNKFWGMLPQILVILISYLIF